MANLQKIVKVTQAQYNTLASGGTVGSYTGLSDDYIYLIEDNNIYITSNGGTIDGGNINFYGSQGIAELDENDDVFAGFCIDYYNGEIIYNDSSLYRPLFANEYTDIIYSNDSNYHTEITLNTYQLRLYDGYSSDSYFVFEPEESAVYIGNNSTANEIFIQFPSTAGQLALTSYVEANPSSSASETLTKLKVGSTIYSVPQGGGGGGTTDYLDLSNKPQINSVTLSGNVSLSTLGIQSSSSLDTDVSTLGYTKNTGTVTGSSLTSNKIIIGGGNSAISASTYEPASSSTTWSDSSDVYLPTMKSVKTYVEGKGYTTNAGTITGVSLNGTSLATSGVADIPAANGTTSAGIVTTGDQTFGGTKKFNIIKLQDTVDYSMYMDDNVFEVIRTDGEHGLYVDFPNNKISINSATDTNDYTFPANSGTVALTSDLPKYCYSFLICFSKKDSSDNITDKFAVRAIGYSNTQYSDTTTTNSVLTAWAKCFGTSNYVPVSGIMRSSYFNGNLDIIGFYTTQSTFKSTTTFYVQYILPFSSTTSSDTIDTTTSVAYADLVIKKAELKLLKTI